MFFFCAINDQKYWPDNTIYDFWKTQKFCPCLYRTILTIKCTRPIQKYFLLLEMFTDQILFLKDTSFFNIGILWYLAPHAKLFVEATYVWEGNRKSNWQGRAKGIFSLQKCHHQFCQPAFKWAFSHTSCVQVTVRWFK